MQRPFYNVSVLFVNSLEIFCQSGGFELLKLALGGGGEAGASATENRCFTPSFASYAQVLELVHSLKEYLEFGYYQGVVEDLRDICLDYAKNRIGADSLRYVTRKD